MDSHHLALEFAEGKTRGLLILRHECMRWMGTPVVPPPASKYFHAIVSDRRFPTEMVDQQGTQTLLKRNAQMKQGHIGLLIVSTYLRSSTPNAFQKDSWSYRYHSACLSHVTSFKKFWWSSKKLPVWFKKWNHLWEKEISRRNRFQESNSIRTLPRCIRVICNWQTP